MEYLTGCMKVLWYSILCGHGLLCVFNLEEVLATNYAMWWAPDGEHLAYAVFNDSVVRDFNFPFYGDFDNIYTDIVSIAYPKVSYWSKCFKGCFIMLNRPVLLIP